MALRYSFVDKPVTQLKTPCLVTTLKIARSVARAQRQSTAFNAATQDFKNKSGESLCVHLPAGDVARIVVVGCPDDAVDADQHRKILQQAANAVLALPVKQAVCALQSIKVKGQSATLQALTIMQTFSLAAYRYSTHLSNPPQPPALSQLRILGAPQNQSAKLRRLGHALQDGLRVARDLGNEPPNICNPSYVLKEARKLSRSPQVKVSSLNEKRMGELGMNAFLAVSRGSDTPAYLITIEYRGAKAGDAPYCLVGKGITFDTGGISLKPAAAMDEMKFDMCGAAAVLGTTKAVIEAKLPINLVTIIAAAENMPSGDATRPGDIVRSAAGKTVEILNTDAEGRLVLCDALHHAQTFKPRTIIDVATLTGAAIVALGSHASAVYANEDKLANALLDAGQSSGDKAWRMPLWDEYQTALKSNFADVANVGGREAGSVTAACFLARFVNGVDWAHMDVAGSAFQGGAKKGSTGRPVPLLFNYLCAEADLI